MAASDRKIAAMYRHFGIKRGYFCRDCSNLIGSEKNRLYAKCVVFGVTSSAASDWKQKQTACGMYCEEYKGRPIIYVLKHTGRVKTEEPIEGQITFDEVAEVAQ